MSTVPKLDERRRRVASERDVPAPESVQDDLDDAEGGVLDGVLSTLGTVGAAVRLATSLSRQGVHLVREATSIAVGRSSVEPVKGDGRFRDETWTSNPAYHRLMQLYLACSRSLLDAIDEADLDWRNTERARFVLSIIVSSLAPTNTFPGNPSALKRVFETGGGSLVSGLRNFVGDARTNRGMPSQVKPGVFEVGRNLAVTPGAVVYRDEVCELLQYTPSTPTVRERPALLIPPQIGRYYFMDLAPGRSFVEHAVGQGLSFFVISWRNPGPEQGDWNLDTYAATVERVIDVAREITASEDVNLLSLCAGGILTAGVLNHLAAEDKHPVHTASFGVTLLDFDVPAPIGALRLAPLLSLAGERSSRKGVLKASDLAPVFTWMRPDDLVWKYWVNNYLLGKDPPPFDILAWNAEGTNLPSALHRQFIDIFNRNVMVSGDIEILGTPVDLSRVELETYVTGATTDHLTPWQGCYRTTQLLSGPSTFVLSNAGHIASLVNPPGNPKAHYFAGPEPGGDPDEWLTRAEKRQGTWWEHWAAWVLERSGEERPAGSLGSSAYPVIEPAPGTYVRG